MSADAGEIVDLHNSVSSDLLVILNPLGNCPVINRRVQILFTLSTGRAVR